MKKYEYIKNTQNGASGCYIEAVRRYLESEEYPHVETIAAILGLKEVEKDVGNDK